MAPFVVVAGAELRCFFGMSSSLLGVVPLPPIVTIGGHPVALMTDCQPVVNLKPFGMCQSPMNPAVVAATAAAQGVLTPQPCMPVPVGVWYPVSTRVSVHNLPVVTSLSMCDCSWGGKITVANPGQSIVKDGPD
jgi:hypothetical protein